MYSFALFLIQLQAATERLQDQLKEPERMPLAEGKTEVTTGGSLRPACAAAPERGGCCLRKPLMRFPLHCSATKPATQSAL